MFFNYIFLESERDPENDPVRPQRPNMWPCCCDATLPADSTCRAGAATPRCRLTAPAALALRCHAGSRMV